MTMHEIDGDLLDSFNIAFYQENYFIEPKVISKAIEKQLEEKLKICNKLKKNYAVFVLINQLEDKTNAA